MSRVLGRLGLAAPAAMAALIVGACGSASSPTAAVPAATVSAAATEGAASSVIVEGTVVDSESRPLADVEVECMGDVVCTRSSAQLIEQDGADFGVKTNAAGAYRMVARQSGGTGRFLMNAAARGYEVTTREVAFPASACSSDRAGCTVAVNFTLTPQAQ